MATNRAGTGTRPGSVARAWRKACSRQAQYLIQPGPITIRNPRSYSGTWSSLKLTYIKWIPTGSIVKRGLISLQANFFNTWTEPGSIIVTRYKLKPKNYRLVSALAATLQPMANASKSNKALKREMLQGKAQTMCGRQPINGYRN